MSEQFIPCYHRSAGPNLPIIRLVVHATCPGLKHPKASAAGEAVGTAHYFQSPSSGGSAHHVGDVKTAVQCATDNTVCWHAPPNRHSLGYEIGGEVTYSRAEWLSAAVWPAVEKVAAEIKADAKKHGIPIRKLTVGQVVADAKGICGHADVSQAFHQSDHTDPGPNFPWDEFMALLAVVKPARKSIVTRVKVAIATRRATKPPTVPSWYRRPLRYTPHQPLPAGPDVTHVQQRLIALRFLPARDTKRRTNADGQYGAVTAAAVEKTQRAHHINPDGVVGPDTARALG